MVYNDNHMVYKYGRETIAWNTMTCVQNRFAYNTINIFKQMKLPNYTIFSSILATYAAKGVSLGDISLQISFQHVT